MLLKDVRQRFIEITGRYDFIDAPEKANIFINAGVRLLDRKVTLRYIQDSTSFHEVPPDVSIVQVPRCWQISRVWALDVQGRGVRILLQETDQANRFTNFWRNIGAPIPSSSLPTHYAILTTRNEDQIRRIETLNMQIPANYVHTGEWNGQVLSIELYPHVSRKCVIEVHGKYYSPPLEEDNDNNLWSQVHPTLLIHAACYELETSYRNTEGARDWMAAIMDELLDIERMEVETDTLKYSVMEG